MVSDTTDDLFHILLVEDSPTDILMTREALEFYKVLNPLQIVEDGVAAMEYLRREGKHGNAPRPSLIILDLNLPRKSGREVLQELKADPDCVMSITDNGRGCNSDGRARAQFVRPR